MPAQKPYSDMTLDELRQAVRLTHTKGKQIISHYKELEKYYEMFEDEINEIYKEVNKRKDEAGLTEQELLDKPTDDLIEGLL